MLKYLVEYIVKQLVDKPDLVVVEEKREEGKLVFAIRVATQDLKRIIGKEGRVVRSLRSLISSIESSDHVDINLDSVP